MGGDPHLDEGETRDLNGCKAGSKIGVSKSAHNRVIPRRPNWKCHPVYLRQLRVMIGLQRYG